MEVGRAGRQGWPGCWSASRRRLEYRHEVGRGQPDQEQSRRKNMGPRRSQLGQCAGLHQGRGNLQREYLRRPQSGTRWSADGRIKKRLCQRRRHLDAGRRKRGPRAWRACFHRLFEAVPLADARRHYWYPEALKRAAAISAKVYNEQNGEYWLKYYQGTREQDKTGNMVELGGSAVNNLNDNLLLFGLQPGANNNFRSTYTVFGNIATQQYPALFKDANKIPDVKEILDTSYVLGASSMLSQTGAEADVASFSSSGDTGTVVSKRDWSIEFDAGKASFTSDGERKMYEIKDDL